MEVNVWKRGKLIVKTEVPFSIGDIIRVDNYGIQYANQERSFENSSFTEPMASIFEKRTMSSEEAKSILWKIIDIGCFKNCNVDQFILRIRNQIKQELLIQYYFNMSNTMWDYYDVHGYFHTIRKGKKEIKSHVINID